MAVSWWSWRVSSMPMLCLLILMCFDAKLDEKAIEDIETTQRSLLGSIEINIFFWQQGDASSIYFNSLLAVRLDEDSEQELIEDEMVSLCSEFLSAGTDTTAKDSSSKVEESIKNYMKQPRGDLNTYTKTRTTE
ncbi:Cytochrome P450 [Canna indica]|uniref:Cytochrome P450 n=1 Tax=Canna indica TaxID=4628 RepID=A0AAQ3KY11_9LILI|nr:Cytochrome P450 [Canna indica]